MLAVAFLAVGVVAPGLSAACDVAGAVQLQASMAQLGSWKEVDDVVQVTWNDFVLEQGVEQKRKLIEAFANTDACIKGRARDIKFFVHGQLIGVASSTTGISLVEAPAPAAARVVPARPSVPAGRAAARAEPSKPGALTVRGKAIQVGMTADEVFAILKPAEMVDQEVKGDPVLPGNLRLSKRFRADGKAFTLAMARASANGPYLVTAIAIGTK